MEMRSSFLIFAVIGRGKLHVRLRIKILTNFREKNGGYILGNADGVRTGVMSERHFCATEKNEKDFRELSRRSEY
jgi:hypothetical protein